MRITAKQLINAGCCRYGVNRYFLNIKRRSWDAEKLLKHAIASGNHQDVRYGLFCMMSKNQRVQWSIFCAESVLYMFEEKHPNDDRPRKAIEAAKNYLSSPSVKTSAAAAAATTTDPYAYAVAYAAATNAYAVAYATAIDVYAAAYAAADAADAADADKNIRKSLLYKGLDILLH